METINPTPAQQRKNRHKHRPAQASYGDPFGRPLGLACALALASATAPALADSPRTCGATAGAMYRACQHELQDDAIVGRATCLNIADHDARYECMMDNWVQKREARQSCEQQKRARRDLCAVIGQTAYDTTGFWLPENFVDPLTIGKGTAPNPYFPLTPGVKVLVSGDETTTITVTEKTKSISGVNCLVVNDLVAEAGQAIEDTDDWYAQDIHGNVWYCGEIAMNFELFEGDQPEVAELVDVDGSWKAFRDGAQPGTLMPAYPKPGQTYRQEMLLGDAEDVATVITATADGLVEGDECNEDNAAIADFAEQMCAEDCLVTLDFTPIEPGNSEHKYYAYGEGLFLEVGNDGDCTVLEGYDG